VRGSQTMKRYLTIPALLIFTVFCGGAPSESDGIAESSMSVDTLRAVDSIGVFVGDSSYVLGAVADFTTLSGGRPAILDRVKGTVSVFDADGTFLYSFGGIGEGPGEFQYPMMITALESGTIVVAELMGSVTALDPSGNQLGRWRYQGMGGLPLALMPFDDSTFVCYYFGMSVEAGPMNRYSLERYHAVTGEVLTTYFHWDGEPNPSTDFTPAYITAAADGNGRVYMSRIENESWMVEVYEDGPEPVDTIALFPDRERGPVNNEWGFVSGCVPVRYGYSDGTSQSWETVNMPQRQPLISQLAVDAQGNLWCRRGGVPGDVWDVVSPGGEHLRQVHVTLPDSAFFIQMDLNPHGILAFDMFTEDYHRLYLME
jgi:hypothetical protein